MKIKKFNLINKFINSFFIIFLIFLSAITNEVVANERVAKKVITDFVYQQLQQTYMGSNSQIDLTIGKIDLSNKPSCTGYQAYLPPRVRFSGRTFVGLKCFQPQEWTLMVAIQISIIGDYIVAANPLTPQQVIGASDITYTHGDLSQFSNFPIQDPSEVIGLVPRTAFRVGQAIFKNQLRSPSVISKGQSVIVIYKSNSFQVSSEGKAQNAAGVGESVQVRMQSGRMIFGTANVDGAVEVSN